MPHSTPSGQQIAQAAKTAKLDRNKRVSHTHEGKKIAFTPADVSDKVKSRADLEAGQVIGVFETEFTDISLPPGSYNVFVANVDGTWRAYAEKDGKVIEATSVGERSDAPPEDREKPKVWKGSGCFWVWLIFVGFNVCW